MAGVLKGQRGLIMGVANERSIAWGIARAAAGQGAELGFTYAGESLRRRVEPLAQEVGADLLIPCDVQDDAQLEAMGSTLQEEWGELDFLVHAVAFADREELKGAFLDTSREGFRLALDVSAYSLVAASRVVAPIMKDGGSILTMTYLGGERVVPNYNVMGVAKAALEACVRYLAVDLGPRGITVNALSAGPIRTLASAGIAGFREMLDWHEVNNPLKRNVTQEDVGRAALGLLSEWGRGTTGEVLHVDSGYHAVGVPLDVKGS